MNVQSSEDICMHLLSIYFVSVVKPAQDAQFGGGCKGMGWEGRQGPKPGIFEELRDVPQITVCLSLL